MKKSEINWTLISIILIVVAAFILFGYFSKYREIFAGLNADYKCMFSVMTSERAKIFGVDQVPALCTPSISVYLLSKLSGSDDKEKIALTLLNELEKCWAKYGSGRFNIFSEWTFNQHWCATCSIVFYKESKIDGISFKDIFEVAKKYRKDKIFQDNYNYFFDEYISSCLLSDEYINISYPVYVFFIKKNMNKLAQPFKSAYYFTVGQFRRNLKERGCSKEEVKSKSLSINDLFWYINNENQLENYKTVRTSSDSVSSKCYADPLDAAVYYFSEENFKHAEVIHSTFTNSMVDSCKNYGEMLDLIKGKEDPNLKEIYQNALTVLINKNELMKNLNFINNELANLDKEKKSKISDNPILKRLVDVCKSKNTLSLDCNKILDPDRLLINSIILNNLEDWFKNNFEGTRNLVYFYRLFSLSGGGEYISLGILNTEIIIKLSYLSSDYECEEKCKDHVNKYYDFFSKNNYISGLYLTSNLSRMNELCDIFIVP
ncbi:MAG: hypothetical protein QXR30_02755 [Candidatus Woesearchaeota archaeon]